MALTHIERMKIRDAYRSWIIDLKPTAFVTLTTNTACSCDHMRHLVKRFFFELDRHRLGNKLRKKTDERIDGHLFIEKPDRNTHVHGCVTVPLLELSKLIEPSRNIWSGLCETGEVKIDVLSDLAERAKYATKEQAVLRNYRFDEQHILLREFFPQH